MLEIDRRYQVFVSSTYVDLTEERGEVIQALLELDCIPAGMELFPASSEQQWDLIKRVIDDCDYYIVIVGGRYGSVDGEGVSYTEREYDYAVETGMPVLGFVHRNPDEIKAGKSEKDPEAVERLAAFRAKVEDRMCKYWEGPADLGGAVSRSLVQEIKRQPQVGWVRGSVVPEADVLRELTDLREENRILKEQVAGSTAEPPQELARLAHGDETVELEAQVMHHYRGALATGPIKFTWNELLGQIGPLMFDEASETVLRRRLDAKVENDFVRDNQEWLQDQIGSYRNIELAPTSFDIVKTQFAATRIIEKSIRKRGVNDENTYWRLTPYGEALVFELAAIPTGETRPPWLTPDESPEASAGSESGATD